MEKSSGKKIGTKESESELVVNGVYAYCRHPITLGFLFAMSGAFLIFDFVPLLLTTLIYVPILLLLLIYEEQELVDRFGDAYLDYRRNTRALIPIKKKIKN